MTTPDERSEEQGYYDRHDRVEPYVGRVIVLLWVFMSGAAAGWFAHLLQG